jgi:hypothetical protein
MARSKIQKLICILVLAFLLLPSRVFSQENRFIHFSWNQDEYASGFEVIVEQQDQWGLYTEIERTFTQDTFVEFALAPGFYRYRIQAYDLLDRPSGDPQWIYAEIFPASPPAVQIAEDTDDTEIADDTEISEEVPPKFKTKADMFLSLGYSPLIPIYGELHQLLDTRVFPAGGTARFSYVPFKLKENITLGLEAALSWNYLHSQYQYSDVYSRFSGLTASALLQLHLDNPSWIVNFRAGGGLYGLLNLYTETFGIKADPINILYPELNAGVGVQWFFRPPFFLEAGLDYFHIFSVDRPAPGYIKPEIGIGLQQ